MTEQYFFDTDCLCAFLWVKEECLLAKLYPGKIVLPSQVYAELQKVKHLVARADALLASGDLIVQSIAVGGKEYEDYIKMTTAPDAGKRIIGKGEAAAIAMVKERGGVLASNNLRDVAVYVEEYGLNHITTGDILVEALALGYITEDEGNVLWEQMKRKRRKLPEGTFSDYLRAYGV